MGMKVSLLYPDLHSLGYILRSGITESHGSSTLTFIEEPPYFFP
jgi:hypothetical protein